MFLSSTCSVPCLAVRPDPQLLGWRTFYSNPRILEQGNLAQGLSVGIWVGCFGLYVCVFCWHHGGCPSSCFMSGWHSMGLVPEFCAEDGKNLEAWLGFL